MTKGIMTDEMYATVLQALTRHAWLLHQSYESYILPEEFINDVLPIIHPLLFAHCMYDHPDDLPIVLPNFSHTKIFWLLIDYNIVQQPAIKKIIFTCIQKFFGELCLYRQQKKYPPTAFMWLFLQIMTTWDFRWGLLPTWDGLAGYPFLSTENMSVDPVETFRSSPYKYRHISWSSLLSVFHDFEHELRSWWQPHEWVVPFLVAMIAYESWHQDIKNFFAASINYNVIDLPAHSLWITQVLFTYIPHIARGQSIQYFLTTPDLQISAYLSLLREYIDRPAVKKFIKTQTIYPQFPTMKSADERLMLALFHLCALGNFKSNEALVDAIAQHPDHRKRFECMMRLLRLWFIRHETH